MMPDDRHYRFLTMPDAAVHVRLSREPRELQIFGNRAGLLSLANTLLWLRANAFRREFLSLGELPFVRLELPLSVYLWVACEEPTGRDGKVAMVDQDTQFEWAITEDDLQRVALLIHCLACKPEHEYDLLDVEDSSSCRVQVRMTDVSDWL